MGSSMRRVTRMPPASPTSTIAIGNQRDDVAEAGEELLTVLRALAYLQQRAVEEPRRCDLQPRGARS